MSWSESDISFKKLNNKRITTNLGKGLAEERGASTIELYAGDLKTDTIPGTPPVSSTSVVEVYDFGGKLQLVPDYSVPDDMTWFATTITGDDVTANDGSLSSENSRLKDWISDKYDAAGTIPGAGYEIKVYDASNNLITKSDPSQWFFDYQTGILMFKNASTAYGSVSTTGPFSIVGYRYIGAKGIGSGAGSVTSISTSGGIQGGPITTTGTISLDLTYSPEWIGTHTYLKNAITSNYVNAINLSNKTASSSGSSNQFSPSLEWIGNVWNTTSSTGNTARFSTRLETTPGTTPTGQLVFKSTVDTGTASWTDRLIISSTGRVEIPGTLKLNNYDGALFASSGVVTNGTLPVSYGGLGLSSFAKGDILVGAGTSIIKLGIGSTSQILTIDYSTSTGVKWADASAVGAGLSSLNGLTILNQYFAVGTAGTDFNISSFGATHTFNIPIAGVGATGLITGIAQTIAGSKTFQDDLYAASNIVLTGAITSGSWAGNAITGLYGGTGYSSYTKGDLIVGAGTTFVKLPVGDDTYVLTANSTTSSGVAWTAASSIGSSTIGTPTDGSFSDGFYNTWTSATTIADAVDNLNELLALIAPAKPGYLTGTTLTAGSVPTYYTVGISAGLGTEWYQAGYGTNSSITRYYISSSTITLNTANQSSIFVAGSLTTSTYGTIYFKRFNSSTPSGAGYGTIDLTTNYAVGYTNNNLKLTGLGISNSIWTKANAQILTYTQTTPGYEGYTIAHTENSQETNTYEVWKDPWTQSNPNPIHSQAATASTYSQSLRYLSGIGFYTTGTGFSVYFKGSAGIFSCCYNTTQIYAISGTGLVTATGTTSSPLYSGELDKTGANHVRVTLNSSSASSFNKYLTVTLYKAGGGTSASNATLSRSINTYSTVSTTTYEGFQDEAQRLVIGSGIAFTSNIDLANGNAQVRSGTLQYPLAADYDTEYGGSRSYTGDQEYQRYFYKTSASTGALTFTGFTASNIAAYGTGSINVLAYLEGDSKWFDLGVLQGSNGNDGSSRALAIAAKTSASGGALNWSFGVYSTGVSGAGNSGRYRVVVILRSNTYSMTSITSS